MPRVTDPKKIAQELSAEESHVLQLLCEYGGIQGFTDRRLSARGLAETPSRDWLVATSLGCAVAAVLEG